MLDLDAARAARSDKEREPLEVRLGGQVFLATRPLPLSVLVSAGDLQEGDLRGLRGVVEGIFGEEQAPAVLKAGLDFSDIAPILEALVGGGEGESPASTG